MRGSEIRSALAKGEKIFGTMLEGPTNARQLVDYLSIGLDFVFIDNEHQPLDRDSTSQACHFFRLNGIAPIVRVPIPDLTHAARVIDGGAQGIIAPYVERPDQVWDVICAAKYRPLKGVALDRVRRSGHFPSEETKAYLERLNHDNLVVIMIESVEGIARLDEILSFREVDAILIGPNDLSVSLGVPDRYDDPVFKDAVETIMARALAAGKGFGLHMNEKRHNEYWVRRGANFTVYARDTFGARDFIESGIRNLKNGA